MFDKLLLLLAVLLRNKECIIQEQWKLLLYFRSTLSIQYILIPTFGPGGRGRRSARGKGRQVVVAGLLRTRRSNFGGDPSTNGAKRPPNSRDGAR